MLSTTFFEAAAILLREGLEAILVLAALAAYLTRAGAGDRIKALHLGASAAIVASLAAAWVFERFYGGAHNDLMEGVVILASAGLMFYVSGWLFLKQDPRAWTAYLKSHTDRVVEGGTLFAVAALAFLAVFREGAETVLFVHALSKTSGGWTTALLAGLAAATVALVVLYHVIRQTTVKLPLRWVFVATSAFLFLMGLKFVGQGLQEFQEQDWVSLHHTPAAETLVMLGLNPTWEALGTQLVLLALAVAGLAWIRSGRQIDAGKTVAGE